MNLILALLLILCVGIIAGAMSRHEMKKTYCPYCKCREECNIGYQVEAACPDDELVCMPCVRQERDER